MEAYMTRELGCDMMNVSLVSIILQLAGMANMQIKEHTRWVKRKPEVFCENEITAV